MILLFDLDLQSLLARATQNQGAGANPANPAAGANPAGAPPVNIPPPTYAMQINSGQLPFDISALTGGGMQGGAADPTAMLQMISQNGYNPSNPMSWPLPMQQMYWGPGQQAQLQNVMMANANLSPMANNFANQGNTVAANALNCVQQIFSVLGKGREDTAKAKEELKQEVGTAYTEAKAAQNVARQLQTQLASCQRNRTTRENSINTLKEEMRAETDAEEKAALRRSLIREENALAELRLKESELSDQLEEAQLAAQEAAQKYKDLKAGKKPEEREELTVVHNTNSPETTPDPKVIKAKTDTKDYTGTTGADVLNLAAYTDLADGPDFYTATKEGNTYTITLKLEGDKTAIIKTTNIEQIQRDNGVNPIDIVVTTEQG